MCKVLSYLHCMHVHVHTCSSLEPLFENSCLDEELRQSVKKTFPEFCRQGIFRMYMSACTQLHLYMHVHVIALDVHMHRIEFSN